MHFWPYDLLNLKPPWKADWQHSIHSSNFSYFFQTQYHPFSYAYNVWDALETSGVPTYCLESESFILISFALFLPVFFVCPLGLLFICCMLLGILSYTFMYREFQLLEDIGFKFPKICLSACSPLYIPPCLCAQSMAKYQLAVESLLRFQSTPEIVLSIPYKSNTFLWLLWSWKCAWGRKHNSEIKINFRNAVVKRCQFL